VTPETDQLLRNATSLLNRAHEAREVGTAAQVLTLIGQAANTVGWAWLVHDPGAEPVRQQLRSLASNDAEMLGWASLILTEALYDDDPHALVDALYARSGFQVLVDIGTWDGPAVDGPHLANIDNDLVEAVTEGRLDPADRPAGIPPSHVWWFPSTT